MKLDLTETKGDVTFWIDENGKLYQKYGVLPAFPIKDGKMTYRLIAHKRRGMSIKYNTNGCNGFSIFQGDRILEDNIWVYTEAERIAFELSEVETSKNVSS